MVSGAGNMRVRHHEGGMLARSGESQLFCPLHPPDGDGVKVQNAVLIANAANDEEAVTKLNGGAKVDRPGQGAGLGARSRCLCP